MATTWSWVVGNHCRVVAISPGQPPGAVFKLDDMTPIMPRNQHEAPQCSLRGCLLPGRERVLPVRPRRLYLPALVHRQDLRLFAALTKLISSIDREPHRFPLGFVWPIRFAVELYEPLVAVTHN